MSAGRCVYCGWRATLGMTCTSHSVLVQFDPHYTPSYPDGVVTVVDEPGCELSYSRSTRSVGSEAGRGHSIPAVQAEDTPATRERDGS